MELSEKLTKQRRAITDDIKNKVNDACVTSVKANSCYESFQKVEILSKECQKLNQGYHHDAFLCMLAAEGLSGIANNSKMTYIQADPGTGKSFAILLLAIALEKASFPAIVVTHNGTVKKHLLALKELLVPSRITIIEMSELPLQPKNGKLLIIDEFPQVFFSEKVAFDDHYELPWLLANAHNWQIIAFSAHQSYDWSQFLDKSFKNSKEFVNGSQFTMIGQQ